MPRWPAFIGGTYPVSSATFDAERTVNLYVQRAEVEGASNAAALYSVPGVRAWSSGITDTGTRALAVANGRLFAVVGGRLWELPNNGVAINRGSLAQDGNPAQMAYNGVSGGNQLGICAGGAVYSFALATNTLSATSLTSGYTHLGYADGYGLAFNPTTGRVQLSALNDFSTFGGSTFFARSKFPDPWRAMFVDPNGLIWMVGDETFEVWYNTGTGTQPWALLSGLLGRHGIVAPFAYSVTNTGNFWIARSPEGGAQFVMSSGGVPQAIGNNGVNTALAGFRRTATIADAELMAHRWDGQMFVNCAFPSAVGDEANTPTLTYDIGSQSWAGRGKWNSAAGRYDLWEPRTHADCFGKHLVGDRTSSTIWELTPEVVTDTSGNPLRRLRRAPSLSAEHKRIPIDNIELLMDVGLGTITGAGSDPQAMLRISVDGGVTYGNSRRASIGRIGKYRTRVNWNRIGAPEECVAEVVWADASPVRVVDAHVNNFEGKAA